MAKTTQDDPAAGEPDRNSVKAAEVVAAVGPPADKLLGKHDKWLVAIHGTPQPHWSSLVLEVLDSSLDLSQLKQRVAEIKAEPAEVTG